MSDGSRRRSDARCPQNAPCADMTAYAFRRHGAYVCHRIDGENQDYQSAVYADCHGFRDYFGVCSPFGICAEARELTLLHCGYAFACYVYLAARRCVETADHVQEGRLSAAAFPDDCGK